MEKPRNYKTFTDQQEGQEIILMIPYNRDQRKVIVFYAISVLTFGIFYLLSKWFRQLEIIQYQLSTFSKATHVEVFNRQQEREIVPVQDIQVYQSDLGITGSNQPVQIRILIFRYTHYKYDQEKDSFRQFQFDSKTTYNDLHNSKSLNIIDTERRLQLFGLCVLDIPIPGILQLIINEITQPFFLFQVFSVALWMYEEYYLYAFAIMFFLAASVGEVVYEVRRNLRQVRQMAYYQCSVLAEREGQIVEMNSLELTPGDQVLVKEGLELPCDGVLLQGTCLADEGMLTGETIPVLKEALPNSSQSVYQQDQKHTLFAGTKILFAEQGCRILVTNTAFNTAKGKIVRSILYPKPTRFQFYKDTIRFLGIMTLIAVACCIWNIARFLKIGTDLETMIVGSLDLITICIPPALPLAMTIGITFAIQRLHYQNITCISPPAINAAGRVSIICFDKTGTLTEDSMRINGGWDAFSSGFFENLAEVDSKFQECIASCHNLAYVNGEIVGDVMEVEAFKQVGWSIGTDNYIYKGDQRMKVVFRYHFESALKRMACVVSNNDNYYLHVKGAPEVILSLCRGQTDEAQAICNKFSQQGFRLLACGVKQLQNFTNDLPLSKIEDNLEFLGLILYQNHVKPESFSIITTLQAAGIKCLMSTGDALLTGVSIAKQCHIISPYEDLIIGEKSDFGLKWTDSRNQQIDAKSISQNATLAITGQVMDVLLTSEDPSLPSLNQCKVFARMSPQNKVSLIESLQIEQVMVAMVGDGTNDCGALRAADIGLSLSKAEASIAAPFTTTELSNLIPLLCEGRGTLMTCFQCFKFIAMYSLIQNSACNIMYSFNQNFTDNQFLYQDIAIIFTMAFFMTRTKPLNVLYNEFPPAELITPPVLISIAGHTLINTACVLISYLLLLQQDWYKQNKDSTIEQPLPSYDNTLVFVVASCQLIIIALVFSVGKNFRQPLYKNVGLLISGILILGFTCCIVAVPIDGVLSLMQAKELESDFRPLVMMVVAANAVICWVFEYFYIHYLTKHSQRAVS